MVRLSSVIEFVESRRSMCSRHEDLIIQSFLLFVLFSYISHTLIFWGCLFLIRMYLLFNTVSKTMWCRQDWMRSWITFGNNVYDLWSLVFSTLNSISERSLFLFSTSRLFLHAFLSWENGASQYHHILLTGSEMEKVTFLSFSLFVRVIVRCKLLLT